MPTAPRRSKPHSPRCRGVHTAKVNFGGGTANVSYDPVETNTAALSQRVQALGYSATTDTPPGSTTRRWQFDVTGMDCGDCAKTIETGLRRLPGISDVQMSFGSGILTVTPAGEVLTEQAVVSAVEQAGYRAAPVRIRLSPQLRPPPLMPGGDSAG